MAYDWKKCRRIVAHPGGAHQDDFLACAVGIALGDGVAPIERRDPTPEEMGDPTVAVIDQGGQDCPELGNFDHHQFGRGIAPCCALTLVLRDAGLEEIARHAWPWLATVELIDSKGPMALAERVVRLANDVETDDPDAVWDRQANVRVWEELSKLMSPIASFALRKFGERREAGTACDGGDWLHGLMAELGRSLVGGLEKFRSRLDRLRSTAHDEIVGGLNVLWSLAVPGDDDPVFALESLCRDLDATGTPIAITVTNDDRGPGLCLFRRNDDPRVDFSRVEGDPNVHFAHKNGFVCKTRTKDVDVARGLIRKALVVS